MTYITLGFYLFVALVLMAYYMLPLRVRWYALLCGSMGFYYHLSRDGFALFLTAIALGYLGGLAIDKLKAKRGGAANAAMIAAIVLVLAPLFVAKSGLLHRARVSLVAPLGIAFYTMQIIAYLADVYKGKILPQRNPLKYALFVSFFPQIVQGPIPRYAQLQEQLIQGHRFDERGFTKGAQLILWGFFLKLMIADKASVIVDAIFGSSFYMGMYALIGGVLYSVQLYADFLACVTLSKGVAALFGIELVDNFCHPYGATSIGEFWRRWHISLSTWLRDYVYIPLGGNRKGKIRKYTNLIVTFAVSGMWHGTGFKYVFWGLMHAAYQIAGELAAPIRERVYGWLKMPKGDLTRRIIQTAGTCWWVMLSWIVFRADTLRDGLNRIVSIFRVYNPWVLINDSLFTLGLNWKEWMVLLASIGVLGVVSLLQNRYCLRDELLRQHVLLRWGVYALAICVIWVCGTYGYGFNAQDFIYGGF